MLDHHIDRDSSDTFIALIRRQRRGHVRLNGPCQTMRVSSHTKS